MNNPKLLSRRQQRYQNRTKRTAAHILVAHKQKIYLWGGYMEISSRDQDSPIQNRTVDHPPDEVWIYEPMIDTWFRKITTGNIPISLCGACAEVYDNHLYIAGGFSMDINYAGYNESVWCLNLQTFVWKLLKPSGIPPAPFDKSACWLYRGRLYIFGGFGPLTQSERDLRVNVSYKYDDSIDCERYWTDQLCYYDIIKNCWVWPYCTGPRPIPRAAHAAALVGSKAYVFGGRYINRRIRDFRYLDLTTHHWTIITDSEIKGFHPEGRSWHTLNTLSDDKLILYGGFGASKKILSDIWIFNIRDYIWTEVDCNKYPPRAWHKSVVYSPGQYICIGGLSGAIFSERGPKTHIESMLSLQFTPPTLSMLTADYISKHMANHQYWSTLPRSLFDLLNHRTDNTKLHGR